MDFVAVMLFTQQVSNLECLFFFWLILILDFVLIKSQSGVGYKSVPYKKSMQRCFQPSKNEEITLPREFIFVLIVKEVQSKVGGWEKI